MGSTKINLTEEQFTEVTLSALKEHPEGITEYPILDFDDRALGLLSAGVAETLRYSEIKPRGGLAYRFLKRLFDIVGSALSLIVLAIPMGIVALVIYLDDKGSPIFSQARLTKDGKVFYMHKFRSMCVDAEQKFAEVQKENETDGLAFKSENDPRITRIGHFIRRTSIDELPQLWDVFCGHIGWIQTQYFRIPIFPKQEIVTAYITDCYDQNECRTVTAKVVQNKTKTKIALMNKSGESWRINNETVAPGERVLIQKGIRIQIKNEYMEIK